MFSGLINKKVVNKTLIEFCLKNNLYVYTPKNFIYHTNGKNYNETIEVFITNYEISQDILKKTEFFKLNPEYCKKILLTK